MNINNDMFSKMERITSLSDIQGGMFVNNNNEQTGSQDFTNIFNDLVGNVRETERDLANEQYKFVTGQTDDTHSVSIASTKAQISLELLTVVRDKALESYNELIKMSI